MKKIIDYNLLVDELKRDIIKKSLKHIRNDHMPGGHHFFITFATTGAGVHISRQLLEKYPKDMTIVLQHQFRNLIVQDNHFSITLYFDGIEEQMDIPYTAITSFADPSEKFGLHFKNTKTRAHTKKDASLQAPEQSPDNVIVLDQFRNK